MRVFIAIAHWSIGLLVLVLLLLHSLRHRSRRGRS
jgi:hypothetical protein